MATEHISCSIKRIIRYNSLIKPLNHCLNGGYSCNMNDDDMGSFLSQILNCGCGCGSQAALEAPRILNLEPKGSYSGPYGRKFPSIIRFII